MTRVTKALLLVVGLAAGAAPAYAQGTIPAEGSVVVTIIPGGATFVTEGKNSNGTSFSNYNLGGSVVGNINKYVGVEGEALGALGISQSLTGYASDTKTPNMLSFNGNVVVSAANHSSLVPYVTGGVGSASVFEKAELGINATETFLTGNVGGGLKWYSGRWGVRVDYRFIAIKSKDDAPAFFGTDNRFAHRVYGGLLVNLGR
jgi:Outer membrane protein beta-barrel domain